jgi:hypothetical protein
MRIVRWQQDANILPQANQPGCRKVEAVDDWLCHSFCLKLRRG